MQTVIKEKKFSHMADIDVHKNVLYVVEWTRHTRWGRRIGADEGAVRKRCLWTTERTNFRCDVQGDISFLPL